MNILELQELISPTAKEISMDVTLAEVLSELHCAEFDVNLLMFGSVLLSVFPISTDVLQGGRSHGKKGAPVNGKVSMTVFTGSR